MTPKRDRAADHRHTAAVCRAEAEARRDRQPGFARVLDTWAANQDRRADEASSAGQPDLFSIPHPQAEAA